MPDEVKEPGTGEETKESSGQQKVNEDGGKVELTGQQYDALLDHVASLEARLMETGSGKKEVETLDDLIEEGQGARPQQGRTPVQKPLEEMNPQEVMQTLMGVIHQKLIVPLETKVETLRIMNEIDKVASKPGNEDFWEYAQTVKEIAIRNPSLSIERAYRLAKTENPREHKGKGEAGLSKKSDLLFTLPKRPSVTGGEKPGASGRGMSNQTPVTRKDAATAAFDEVMGGKK